MSKLAFAAIVLAAVIPAVAQQGRGSYFGTVTDTTGAAIPGAKVTLTNVATNTMRATRGRWLDLFADYNAQIDIVYIEPPFSTIIRQNRERSSAIPENGIRRLAEKCEPPTWLECHRLQILSSATAEKLSG